MAERIAIYEPDLAKEIFSSDTRVLTVYRGISIAPKDYKYSIGRGWIQRDESTYASAFATGLEGHGTDMMAELNELRQSNQYWGVLLEMEIPEFAFISASSHGSGPGSIGQYSSKYIRNEALFITRIGTHDLRRSHADLESGQAIVWVEFKDLGEILGLDLRGDFESGF